MTDDRITRGRTSKVKQLPEEIRAQLHAMLRNGGITQKDILADINKLIDEAGLPDELKLTRSGLNRYATDIESIGKEMREIREVTDAWVARVGDKPTGEVSKLLVEMLRTQSFRLMLKFQADPEAIMDPETLGDLALAIQRMERAAMLTHEREKEIRLAFAEQVASTIEKKTVGAGMSRATIDEIKKEILGIA